MVTTSSATLLFNQLGCTSTTVAAIGTAAHLTLTIIQPPPFTGGSILNATQDIGYGGVPSSLNDNGCQWRNLYGDKLHLVLSTDGTNFSTVPGGLFGPNYQPGGPDDNDVFQKRSLLQYRRYGLTNVAIVTVDAQFPAATISTGFPNDQLWHCPPGFKLLHRPAAEMVASAINGKVHPTVVSPT